jgi:alpha-tubulin suppressor-like RCC1 family protein
MEAVKRFLPGVLPEKQRFKVIEAAGETSFGINESDELFGWGRNDLGQVGQDPAMTVVKAPVKIMQSKGLHVAPGSKHVFAYNNSSKVVCWGCNENGQLGKDKSSYLRPSVLKIFEEAKEIGLELTRIACGEDHSLAIMTDSEGVSSLFSWGNNKFWQLAVDSAEDVPYPFKTDFQEDPVEVAAKHNFSGLVTRDGRVYTWGSGEFGRLGYETLTKQERVPRQISELEKIEKLVLGIYHGLAVNFDGRVFSWGRGLNGQLGHNSLNN